MGNTPSTSNWNARPLLERLAKAGMLVECGCYGCRRKQTYLASDLAAYLSPQAEVGSLWSACPYCKSGANWWERYRYPTNDDVVNRTIIRKLKGWETTAIWASEPYEAPKPPEPELPSFWSGR